MKHTSNDNDVISTNNLSDDSNVSEINDYENKTDDNGAVARKPMRLSTNPTAHVEDTEDNEADTTSVSEAEDIIDKISESAEYNSDDEVANEQLAFNIDDNLFAPVTNSSEDNGDLQEDDNGSNESTDTEDSADGCLEIIDEVNELNEAVTSNDITEEAITSASDISTDEKQHLRSTDDSPALLEKKSDAEKATAATTKKTSTKTRTVDNIFDFVELFVFTLAAVFIITSFFFRYSIVDGGSMDKTLAHNEKLILRSFLYEPENGDIVVVQDKSTELKQPIVKRIIATEGQTVRFYSDSVLVDGKELDEPYVYTDDFFSPFSSEYTYDTVPSEALLSAVTDSGVDDKGRYYEITVPKDHIFVMGDHRNVSKDSRTIGTIHEDAVIGKAVLRFYPFDKFGTID